MNINAIVKNMNHIKIKEGKIVRELTDTYVRCSEDKEL